MVIEGNRCIEGFRALAGATDPTAALPGTIRGDLGRDWGLKVQENIVHGSDSAGVGRPRDRDLVPQPLTDRTPDGPDLLPEGRSGPSLCCLSGVCRRPVLVQARRSRGRRDRR